MKVKWGQGQSGRMEAPSSTLQTINVFNAMLQNISVFGETKSGKYASDKKVARNTLILSKVEAPAARLLKGNLILATFSY